jgi:hypothetical protein
VARAQSAQRRIRELDPEWQAPRSISATIEGRIAHQEAVTQAAEARLAQLLRDAIPNTNPSWGVNRLRSELSEQGYILSQPARRGRGYILENPQTGEQVRIMERPERRYRSDPAEKHIFRYYYRFRPGFGQPEGAHTPIPDR